MKISQFTKKEIEYILERANFTECERECFLLKSKGKTNIELSMKLNICESTVSVTMKSVRAKITAVLEQKAKEKPKSDNVISDLHPAITYFLDFLMKLLENTPIIPESHTTKEWAEMPDKVSIKDKLYVVTDFRNDDDSPGIPRFKYGDGISMVSELPFCTAAITDNDVRLWDLQTQISQKNQ